MGLIFLYFILCVKIQGILMQAASYNDFIVRIGKRNKKLINNSIG